MVVSAFLERFSARKKGSLPMKCKETECLRFQMSDFNEDLIHQIFNHKCTRLQGFVESCVVGYMLVSLALTLVLKFGSFFLAVFNLIRHAHIMPA